MLFLYRGSYKGLYYSLLFYLFKFNICDLLIFCLCLFIAEEVPNSSDEENKEKVSLDTWLKKPDVSFSCKCNAIGSSGYMFPR